MDQTENLLIHQCRNGSTEAFGKLVSCYETLAYRTAVRMLRNSEDAEDIVQEAFLRVWNHRRRLNAEKPFSTWLYRIVTNLCLDRLKSAHYKRQQPRNSLPDPVDPAGSPESILKNREIRRLIDETAAALPPVQKTVFILRDMEALSVKEVAKILGTGTGAVKTNLYLARKQIRAELKQSGYDHA